MATVPLDFPFTAFRSELPMDDYLAPDMKCGDLTEKQLIDDFGLSFVSFHVDPFNNEEKFIIRKIKEFLITKQALCYLMNFVSGPEDYHLVVTRGRCKVLYRIFKIIKECLLVILYLIRHSKS